MIFSVPYVGLVVRLLQTTVGKLVVIALAVFLLNRSWRSERMEGDEALDQIKEEIRRLKAAEEAALAAKETAPSSEAADVQSNENRE